MSQGQGSFQTNQRTLPSGAPFTLNSANNGLSVDPVTLKIVLGQSVGAVGNPARLLNNRQIPLNGFSLEAVNLLGFQVFLLDDVNTVSLIGAFDGLGGQAFYSGQVVGGAGRSVVNAQDPNTTAQLLINTNTGIQESAEIAIQDTTVQSSFLLDNLNRIAKISFGNNIIANPFLQLDANNKLYQIGDVNNAVNGTRLIVDDASQVIDARSIRGFQVTDIAGNDFLSIDSNTGNFLLGDDNGLFNGATFFLTQNQRRFRMNGTGGAIFDFDQSAGLYQMGDLAGTANGLQIQITDGTGNIDVRNTALAAFFTINGVPGFSGTVANPATITVDGGIVTNVA